MARLLTPDDMKEHRVITLEISNSIVDEFAKKVLARYRKKVKIPGFRPGKAPEAIIMAQFGEDIRMDAIAEAAEELLKKELESRKLDFIANIKFTDLREKPDGSGYTVTAEFDTIPRFDIPPLNQIVVTKKIKRVTELEVEKRVRELLNQLGEYVPVDREAKEGDFIFFDLTIYKVKSGGKLRPVEKYENRMLKLDSSDVPEDLLPKFIGKKAGDKVETEHEITDEKGQKALYRYVYEIRSVREFQVPELDDEVAQDLGFESVEDMRQKIRDDLEKKAHEESERDVEAEIAQKIYELVGFDIPQALLESNKRYIREKIFNLEEGKEGKLQELIDALAMDLTIQETVIYNVIDELDPEVTEEEINEELEKIAQANNLDKDAYIEELKKRGRYEDVVEDIKNRIRRRKAWDYLKSGVKMEVVIE